MNLRIVLLVATCMLAPGASAQQIVQRIADRQQVNVGYSENAAPFSFLANGEPAGYSIDICMQVVAAIKLKINQPELRVKLSPVAPDQLPRLVGSGAVDLMCGGVSDTPERRRTMSFSSPIFLSAVKLLVLRSGARAVSDLKGGTVVVLGRTTAESAVMRLSTQRGLALKVSRVAATDAALSQLRLRQADAWARDEVLLLGTIARESDARDFSLLHDVLSTEVIAIAMPRDEEMVRFVNAVLGDSVRSGRMNVLYSRWFSQTNADTASGLNMPMSPALKAEFDRLQ